MTSALQRLQANEDDTIWRQNVSVIRQLYQEERKTLKEVKTIMENDRGFPETPLSIWEVKLRRLGMQKKLKARDWSLVYQHVRPRLQQEGKKKLRKPTAFLINDTKKTWDDVWKEIRRNGVLRSRPRQGPLPPLPFGIVMRTPSPELLGNTLRKEQEMSPQCLMLQLFQTTLVGLQPLLELDSKSSPESRDVLKFSDSVYRLCLEGIPFTILLERISEDFTSSGTVATLGLGESQGDQITSAFCLSSDITVTGHSTSWKSQLTAIIAQLLPGLESAPPSGQEVELNFDSHHYLSMVIYLLSNDNIKTFSYLDDSQEVTMAEVLRMTFTFVPRRLLLTLLHIHLPSIKAAWEKLLLGAQRLKNEEAFRFLISVGMENDWLEKHAKGHEYLFSAAQMSCSDILRALIARGCRTDSYPSWCYDQSIIAVALEHGSLDCAKLLIQNCDVNHEFQTTVSSHKSTHFAKFIMAFDNTRLDHHDCLEILLKQGADVDYQIDPEHPLHHPSERNWWYWDKAGECGLKDDWPLSILDYVYYWHRSLFPKLAEYTETVSQLSRARALWYLDQGVDTLREYLASDPDFPRLGDEATGNDTNDADGHERKNRFLEILLAEQFLLSISDPVEKVWWTRVKGLSELEIDLTWLSETGELAANMIYASARLITSGEGPDKDHGLQVLQWLLQKGFQVNADALWAAYFNTDVAILNCIASFCDDLKKEGGKVLAQAVWSSNFTVTKLLLDKGVDPNPTIVRGSNVFESAVCGSTFAMMKYVIQRGAKPRALEQGDHLSDHLFLMFRDSNDDMFIKVQYLVEKYFPINEPSYPSANLLEACIAGADDRNLEERRTIFEFLWKKGAKLSPGSPLAVWIATGGGHRLIQEMLDAGADPHGRSFDTDNSRFTLTNYEGQTPMQAAAGIGDYTLVCMLLDRGADPDEPALGDYDMTSLQAICVWDPVRQEERMRKDSVIKLLLDKGADVNASNYTGHTALIHAAKLGDLSTAFTLLSHGAKLDPVSMFRYENVTVDQQTALDAAAYCGRLDMVEFLLNANALSWTACSDGKDYDGAIEWARKGGHFVVSELICKHLADRRRWDVSRGQAFGTSAPQEHRHQSLSLRAKWGAASWAQTEEQLAPSENLQDVANLDQSNFPIHALSEGMAESGTTATKADVRGTFGAEATEVGYTRVIEEIEDEPPPADAGWERSSAGKSDEAANKAVGTRQALSGPGGWLYQPIEQNWVEDEQQNVDPPVLDNLSTDVFMGFSEFPSP